MAVFAGALDEVTDFKVEYFGIFIIHIKELRDFIKYGVNALFYATNFV